jgi:hypothetical protein
MRKRILIFTRIILQLKLKGIMIDLHFAQKKLIWLTLPSTVTCMYLWCLSRAETINQIRIPSDFSSHVGHRIVILTIDSFFFSLLKLFFAFYNLPTIGWRKWEITWGKIGEDPNPSNTSWRYLENIFTKTL